MSDAVNGRLVGEGRGSLRYVLGQVLLQWVALVANVALVGGIAHVIGALLEGRDLAGLVLPCAAGAACCLAVRAAAHRAAAHMGYLASRGVKDALRRALYDKLLRLGPSYGASVPTSEVVQVAGEGVEQIETYFGLYLPQLIYALIAPATLFAAIAPVSLPVAVGLIACVPLIPIAIAAVQTVAKRLLASYWEQYAELGDSFLENLQGLTTLKVFEADGHKARQMDEEAETFRRVTMRVLTMQLNSIIIMDLVAYGGAALGIVLAAGELAVGRIGLPAAFALVLLASALFARSSPRFDAWLRSTRLYGSYVVPFRETGGMTVRKKATMFSVTAATCALSFVLVEFPPARAILVAVVLGMGAALLFRIRTISPEEEARVRP